MAARRVWDPEEAGSIPATLTKGPWTLGSYADGRTTGTAKAGP